MTAAAASCTYLAIVTLVSECQRCSTGSFAQPVWEMYASTFAGTILNLLFLLFMLLYFLCCQLSSLLLFPAYPLMP